MKRCSLSVGIWRRASARGALAVAALLALFLVGLLSPGATEGNSAFNVDGTVAKIQITYEGACVPGNLDTTITLAPITTSSPKPINVTGNVSGCFGTDALPGTVLIGNELFRYTNFYTETMSEIEAAVTSFTLQVEDCSDFVGTPSELYVGGERMIYSGMDCSGPPPDTITINGRPEGSTKKHVVGSLVRAQGKLKLVARAQPRYAGGGSEADTTPAEHSGQEVKSPVTYLTCRGRLDQTSQPGPDPVSSRSRCYAILEPGYDPPQAPANRFWPDPYPGPLLLLIPVFYHEQATGDINDQDASSTTQLFMTAEYALYRCFALVENQLWIDITSDVTVDKASFDEDLGVFKISIYTNGPCTGDPIVLDGPDPMNFHATEIAADTDSDGDGCPDFDELGSAQGDGGKRDPFNPWDYFNPTNDGRVRSDDILLIVNHYRDDPPSPTYDEKYDRTGLGPGDWNFGPPNGSIRSADILAAVKSYRHDCGDGIVKD